MSAFQVLILAGIAIVINRLKRGRSLALLTTSVLVMYWLQPYQEPTSVVFWLPTAMLFLIVGAWLLTAVPEMRAWNRNWRTAIVLMAAVLIVDLGRYFPIGNLAVAVPPRIQWMIPVFLGIIFITFISSKIGKVSGEVLVTGCLGLVALLFLVKVPSAFSATLRWLAQLGGKSVDASNVSWLGFSYVAFRLLHTIVDRIAGRLPPLNLVDYLNYVLFFPSLTAGPIDRVERFTRDLNQPRQLESSDWLEAGQRVFTGLFKKFVIADALGWIALNESFLANAKSAGWIWVFLYAYSLQIYFDFSGYTDIAIGIGRLMGIRLPENFNAPYLKSNITQFWNSWHMSLTQWFRSYYFNPLTRRMRSASGPLPVSAMIFFSQLSTMVLIGLWHGVSQNFFLWGVWHGLGLFIQNRWTELTRERILPSVKFLGEKTVRYAGIFLTFHFVTLGWLFFIFPSPVMTWRAFQSLVGTQ